jgi:hypothetical protein
MNRRTIINEEEKRRILNLHETRRSKELGFLFEAPNQEEGVYNNDKDYDYKKENGKYFFKLKANPVSAKAKGYKSGGKFLNWTQATNQEAINAISKLPFISNLTAYQGPGNDDGTAETELPKDSAPTTTATTTPTTTATTPTTTATTPTTATTTPTTATAAPTAQLRTGKEIRQDYRQQKQTVRQDARQERKDTRQLEAELKNLQAKALRLDNKMTDQDKAAYYGRIAQIKSQLGIA